MSTRVTRPARRATSKMTLALLTMLGTVGVAQAARVQVNVNAAPKLCTRFLADLRGDHITKMTMGQLCRYDFVERHAGGFYRQLNWRPVSGDAVALTMKIFEANMQPATNPRGIAAQARERAATMLYAQEQERHNALRVEMAPFRIENPDIPGTGSVPAKGYILRSRSSYCGTADKMNDNPAGSNAAGRVLIALFADKALKHPVPDIGGNLVIKSFPVVINGEDMVIGLWTNWLHYHGFDPTGTGPQYWADIEAKGFMHYDNEPAKPLQVYSRTICAYKIYVKNGVK